jgi:hypothetical protein
MPVHSFPTRRSSDLALYRIGHRGLLDFVDDNFIGNKKAVKNLLPHLIAWQKAHGYPFEFSTEASINLADDDALLALMREANFMVVFVGIESPDPDTLVSMQKKQNTRRVLADCVHKIYRAGMFVIAGFIVGFDSEKNAVADAMVDCIEATAIPVCMVGLLYALPNTQLTRRLEREGRLFPASHTMDKFIVEGGGDQCIAGLNFHTARPRRDVLLDYKQILERIYAPAAYYARVRTVIGMLDRPVLDRPAAPAGIRIGGVSLAECRLLGRLVWRIALRQPKALGHFWRALRFAATNNPRALGTVGVLAAFYLHLGPFSRFVIDALDRQIADAESDAHWAPANLGGEIREIEVAL